MLCFALLLMCATMIFSQTTRKTVRFDIEEDAPLPCVDNLVQADCGTITVADCKKYHYYNTKYCCQTCKTLLK